ncbi:Rpn family recombination-promoting nuclease/putative transposase [Candidatus Babeliales bacterium]|nr:Rpn family recombination-promoting nuclease/putative transposase [Candidatus Babeliales bacterium]MBP9843457.1 Rpn family recombination-promoting nuclease/putative transposase [Candidatus Babeliales bacterium]
MMYLNPTTDTGFKKLFGNEHRKNLTISFLNSILERKQGELIVKVSFRDTANLPEIADKKKSFVDIYCTDEKDNHYIIEMQVSPQKYFPERAQYYASFALAQQLNSGAKYDKLVPVIFIAVLDHILFTSQDAISHHFIMNAKTSDIVLKHLNFHFVELPKFHKKIDELKTDVDKWIFFIKNAETYEQVPQELQNNKELVEAFHTLEKAQWTNAELENYIVELDELGRDSRIEEAGFDRGIAKGQQEAKTNMAIKLLKKKTPEQEVADLTDLSLKEIDLIKKSLKK